MTLERRTPLKRTALRSGGRLRARSSKQRARDMVLAENRRAAIRRDGNTCQAAAALPTPCDGGLHAHHVLPRSRGGPHDVENLLTLCGFHHGWVHGNPTEAKALGFLK